MTLKLAIIGTGLKACEYVTSWLKLKDVKIHAVADVNKSALEKIAHIFEEHNRPSPQLFDDWKLLLQNCSPDLDAVYISTPHVFHAEQAEAALLADLDVLLEKPMVTTVDEAHKLIRAKHDSGREVVIGYQGALSPLVQKVRKSVQRQEFGDLVSVSATIWEDWATKHKGNWKQKPGISGGGFMFDTGAHLMNTVCLLCDSDFIRVGAFMKSWGYDVDIVAVAQGELVNGGLVTLQASGQSIPQCESQIDMYFTNAIVHVDAWGRWLEIEFADKPTVREEMEIVNNPLQVFQNVCAGKIENPSTVEQGMRFALLWDAIKESAKNNGASVTLDKG